LNSLAYAILGILSRGPQSGYNLGKQLELIWAANLSQIYPLLSKLKNKEFVSSEQVVQTGKPNKINYRITNAGLETLNSWIKEKPAIPIVRDEFLTKILSIWLTDKNTAINLLEDRQLIYMEQANQMKEIVEGLETKHKYEIDDPSSMHFSRYVLFKRRFQICQEELEWCKWVLTILEK
jgi:DNA-binding PadR family transcriptional regulator